MLIIIRLVCLHYVEIIRCLDKHKKIAQYVKIFFVVYSIIIIRVQWLIVELTEISRVYLLSLDRHT